MADFKAIDFFCGAGGMTHGMRRAGINVLCGIDFDGNCQDTYTRNNAPAKFVHRDIREMTPEDLTEEFGIQPNQDDLIFIGCSPCQYWSKIRSDKRRSEAGAFLLLEFQRFVLHFTPAFVVIENVPGLSKSKRSCLDEFIGKLEGAGYDCSFDVISAADYGVPQTRERLLLIGSRDGEASLPKKSKGRTRTVRDFISDLPAIEAGHRDQTQRMHTASALEDVNLERIRETEHDGGTREGWQRIPHLALPAYENRDKDFKDVYGRMFWDRPAPTITTRFNSLSNGRFGHPEQDRAISFREGALLQTFPKSYRFSGQNQAAIARQIGNAVPPELARRIGGHLIKLAERS